MARQRPAAVLGPRAVGGRAGPHRLPPPAHNWPDSLGSGARRLLELRARVLAHLEAMPPTKQVRT
jgi:hypothetical protein